MDRRKSLKVMVLGTVSSGLMLEACKTEDKKTVLKNAPKASEKKHSGLMKEEVAHLEEVNSTNFFTPHEMQTFIVKDKPENQVPMRGGLRWLDLQCLNRYKNPFSACNHQQQMEMVDDIAWPKKAKPEMKAGVKFFNLMRNLTATGFYTSEIGVKDVGYIGNTPNQWNGVPDDVLKQYHLAYTEKELKECISFS